MIEEKVENLTCRLNYKPSSISFLEGFSGPPPNSKDFRMRYDERKAKLIIEHLLENKRNIKFAKVGLDGDWHENSSILYSEGKFNQTDFWDNSTWATPVLIVTFADDLLSECYEVWKKE